MGTVLELGVKTSVDELNHDNLRRLFYILAGRETKIPISDPHNKLRHSVACMWGNAARPRLYLDDEGRVHAVGFRRFDT